MTTTYLGQNLVTQGLVTIVGIRLGSIQVVLFSTVRTLCNFAKQMIGIVNLSVFTEFSISTGHKDLETIRKLHINSVRANVCLTLLAVIGLRLFGPWVLSIWTKGAVEVEEPFFLLYTLYLLVNSFWTGSWTMLLASNQHQSVTWYYLLMSCLVLITSYTTLSFWGLSIVPVSLILSDLVFSWVVLSTSLHVVQQSSANFIHQLFSLPIKVESEG
jgi:O-antigen/teichoic acid export membrane protein